MNVTTNAVTNTFTKMIGLLCFTLLATTAIYAADLPGTANVAGNELVLNGTGMRKATMLKVKVYEMGLYLSQKNSDPQAIIANPQPARLSIHFVRKVKVDKITKGWTEGFVNNTADTGSIQSSIDSLNGMMENMKKGDSLIIDLHDNKTDVMVNGTAKGSIEGATFQKALMSIWLGDNPPNPGLKTGILGK